MSLTGRSRLFSDWAAISDTGSSTIITSIHDYKEQYEQSQTINNPDGDPQLKTFRDFYKDQRDDFVVYALILYVVNLIDAYVDAQLFDFDVSDSKSFPNGRMTFKINF
jgi:hypothetical protein